MNKEFIDFVNSHLQDDTSRLLLTAARYPSIDMPAAVQQIEGLRAARDKWPSLLGCPAFLYPPRLNREQSSSEATAAYKARLAIRLCGSDGPAAIADLTGGMGIDTLAFAQPPSPANAAPPHIDYIERDPGLCALMRHNSQALKLDNIDIHQADSLQWLSSHSHTYDILFCDPARRSAAGRKVAAFEQCEPNILQHLPLLLDRCRNLIVKASPMIDIALAQRQLGHVAEVHILSVKGECKEVLFVCNHSAAEAAIHCDGQTYHHTFTRSQESATPPRYSDTAGHYLYEPDAALMKGAPFNLISQWMDMPRLSPHTHLYTSDTLRRPFPGRAFAVLGELKPNRKEVARAIPSGRAHVVVRNFPADAATLQRQLGLAEGGDLFVVATTVGTRKTAFLCAPAAP